MNNHRRLFQKIKKYSVLPVTVCKELRSMLAGKTRNTHPNRQDTILQLDIDIAKNVFLSHGVGRAGNVKLRKRVVRSKFIATIE